MLKSASKAPTSSLRAALYLRISQDRSGAQAGVDRQELECRKLAEQHGWSVTAVYQDNDTSAFSGKVRPRYAAMMEDAESGRFDVLIAWHPDRLYRRLTDLETFVATVKNSGIEVATVKAGRVDLTSAAGQMQAEVLGVLAKYESNHKAERITSAAEQRARAGKFSGGVRPYGYETDGVTLVPAEAAALVEAFESVIAGVSLAEIARRMPAKVAGVEWKTQPLRGILISPRMAGLSVYKGDIVGPAEWPEIVDQETWQKARTILTDPSRRTSPGSRPNHLLSGIVTCGVEGCGKMCRVTARVRSSDRSGTLRYRCPRGHTLRSKLPLETYVIAETMKVLRANSVTRPIADPSASNESREARAEVERLTAKLSDLADDYGQDLITRDQFVSLTKRTRARIADLQAIADPTPLPTVLAAISEDPNGPEAAFRALDLPRQRALMRAMWRVTLFPTATARGGSTKFLSEGITLHPQW